MLRLAKMAMATSISSRVKPAWRTERRPEVTDMGDGRSNLSSRVKPLWRERRVLLGIIG